MRKLWLLVALIIVAAPRIARAQTDPFDPVWAIMTQPLGIDSKGCRGCHVGPDPGLGPYWGDDQATVRQSIEAAGLVVGGRMSYLASRLRAGDMPLFGMPWEADDLTLLDAWLITYEPAPDPFDPVWAIMTQPAGPDSTGCRGCHVGPAPALGPYWGDDEETVRSALDALGLTTGGRMGQLAWCLEAGEMPMNGMQWGLAEFTPLYIWLQNNYE